MAEESVTQRFERSEAIVATEWQMFQRVRNEGGRAACQDDLATFQLMRMSQFLTWPTDLLDSYAADLADAELTGRNLLTEKYARMMASSEPERYASDLEPHLPQLSAERITIQEEIIATQLEWEADFIARYPRLGAGMRVLRTEQDTLDTTSYETYLRGELGTYSLQTLVRYRDFVATELAEGKNLAEQTVRLTVRLSGYPDLAAAEAEAGQSA